MDLTAARCLSCDYALRGLPDPRCPECGRPFDPADPFTVAGVPRPVRPPAERALRENQWPALTWAFATIVAAAWLRDQYTSGPARALFAVAGGCVVGLVAREPIRAILLRRRPDVVPPRRWPWRKRWTIGATLAIVVLAYGAAVTTETNSCPHGDLWGTLGVGVAHSTTGGPCHNYLSNSTAIQHVTGPWYVYVK